jgi:RNA polymerase sigma factor (sigma-70 family)
MQPTIDDAGPSDAELITRVRAGDRSAFGDLYSRHARAATAMARQISVSGAEADDLVAESFARVLDSMVEGRGPDSAFRAYLFTTIRHTAYDRSRKDKRLQFTDDLTPHETPTEHQDPVLLQMENSFIAQAFTQLPERWQTVLWHTQVEGQTPAEVGAILGMSANAVTSLAFRAREGLREAYLQVHMSETVTERCKTTIDRLGAYTRGGLSRRETAQVQAHLAECDRCPALAAELSEINSGLRGLLAPLFLGSAAAGYVSTLPAVPVLTQVGAVVGGGAAVAGAGKATGFAGVVQRAAQPSTFAGAGIAAAVATVIAIVIAVATNSTESADPLAVTPVVTSAAAGAAPTGTAGGATPTPTEPSLTEPSLPSQPAATQPTETQPTETATQPTEPTTAETTPAPETTTPATTTASPTTTAPPPTTPTPTTPNLPATTPAPAPVVPPAPPAPSLAVAPAGTATLAAGGTGVLTLTVQNTGGNQPASTATIAGTPGVGLVGVSTAAALRKASIALAAPAVAPAAVGCETGTCTLPEVPSGQTVTLSLSVKVANSAATDQVSVTLYGQTVAVPVSLTSGYASISLGGSATAQAGSNPSFTLTATTAPGVTDPGPLTVPAQLSPQLWVTSADGCTKLGDGNFQCPAGTRPINVRTVALPSASGDQTVALRDAGNRSVRLASPIRIAALAAGRSFDMTGAFGGVSMGAATVACPRTNAKRSDCPTRFDAVNNTRQLVVPDGRTVVWARLSWAAAAEATGTDPATGRPYDLSKVSMKVGSASPQQVTGQPVAAAKSNLVSYSADVTSLISGSTSVAVTRLAASTQTIGEAVPFGGWTLTVVYSDPTAAADAKVSFRETPATLGGSDRNAVLASVGPRASSVYVTMYAVDPWGSKKLTGATVSHDPLNGFADPDADAQHRFASGYQLLPVCGAAATRASSLTLTSDGTDSFYIGPVLQVTGNCADRPR